VPFAAESVISILPVFLSIILTLLSAFIKSQESTSLLRSSSYVGIISELKSSFIACDNPFNDIFALLAMLGYVLNIVELRPKLISVSYSVIITGHSKSFFSRV
jgi:hypothetical protein